MARIRTIKPTFFTSLTIADLTYEQRLTFIGLWTHVDDDGRCIYDPRLLKAAIWPLDNRTADDVADDVRALTEASLITHYTVGERSYLHVKTWAEHQRINRKTPSTLPDPETGEIAPLTCGDEDSVSAHGGLTEGVHREGKGKEGKGEDARKRATTLPADWKPTPEHVERAQSDGTNLSRELEKFKLHIEEKGITSKSWNLRFTRWLINAAEYAERDGGNGSPKRPQPQTLTEEEFAKLPVAKRAEIMAARTTGHLQ